MFQSLMTVIKEIYLYLTKVMFMSEHSVKLRHFINYLMWQNIVVRHVLFAVQIGSHTALHTTQVPLYDILPHHIIYKMT